VTFRFGKSTSLGDFPRRSAVTASQAWAKLAAPVRCRSRQALSRLIPTHRAASATEPVSASMPMNRACRSGVHPSARARSGTGRNGGTRA
jgi:hypothetical protein